MKFLLDTHLLLWAALSPERLSATATALLQDEQNMPLFSAVSIWEVAIKSALGREDFRVDPGRLRRGLQDNGWEEVPVTSDHAVATMRLPSLHKDPFDRLLIAQASVEGIMLLTADRAVSRYPGSIQLA